MKQKFRPFPTKNSTVKLQNKKLGVLYLTKKNGKASGPDEISAEIIQASYEYIPSVLVSFYNKLFENAKYPKSWALDYIIPILKGGDSKSAKNYCVITLNNILTKNYSQIL